MRLVDREQGDGCAIEQRQETWRQQAFRGDVEQVEFAIQQLPFDLCCSAGIQTGIEEGRMHAELAQRLHLVLHQRDQR